MNARSYFGARYYRGSLGRFTTPDPGHVNGDVGDPQSWNAYAYVRNNPLRFTDPHGRDWWDILNGALNAFASNAGFAPRSSGNSDYRKGQLIGDVSSLAFSRAEFVGGGTVSGTGVVACATGAGCLAGAPAMVAGVGLMAHSLVVATNGGISLMKSVPDGGGGYKVPKTGVSGKEAAKDVPSWASGNRPRVGESGKDFADRLCREKYGSGNCPKGPGSEFSKIQKWGDRAFVDPQ